MWGLKQNIGLEPKAALIFSHMLDTFALGFCSTFALGCAAEVCIIALSYRLSPAIYPPNYAVHKQWLWHTTAAAIFPAVAVPYYAFPGTLALWRAKVGVATLLTAPANVQLWKALGFSLAHFTVDGVVLAVKSKQMIEAMRKPLWMQMIAHHALSILLWPKAFLDSVSVFAVGYFMVTEVTNVMLNTRWFLVELKVTGPLKVVWDVVFVVSYTVVRILTIPAALWVAWVTDWSAYASHASGFDLLLTLAILIPFAFNIFWYSLILKGIRALFRPKEEEKKREEAFEEGRAMCHEGDSPLV